MVRLEVNLTEEERETFITNAKKLQGGPRGVQNRGAKFAILAMNTVFSEVDGTSLYGISKELKLPPWKVLIILLKIAILVYKKYGIRFFEYSKEKGVKTEDEHLRLVDKFFDDLEKD
jgi:hypothetical protein